MYLHCLNNTPGNNLYKEDEITIDFFNYLKKEKATVFFSNLIDSFWYDIVFFYITKNKNISKENVFDELAEEYPNNKYVVNEISIDNMKNFYGAKFINFNFKENKNLIENFFYLQIKKYIDEKNDDKLDALIKSINSYCFNYIEPRKKLHDVNQVLSFFIDSPFTNIEKQKLLSFVSKDNFKIEPSLKETSLEIVDFIKVFDKKNINDRKNLENFMIKNKDFLLFYQESFYEKLVDFYSSDEKTLKDILSHFLVIQNIYLKSKGANEASFNFIKDRWFVGIDFEICFSGFEKEFPLIEEKNLTFINTFCLVLNDCFKKTEKFNFIEINLNDEKINFKEKIAKFKLNSFKKDFFEEDFEEFKIVFLKCFKCFFNETQKGFKLDNLKEALNVVIEKHLLEESVNETSFSKKNNVRF